MLTGNPAAAKVNWNFEQGLCCCPITFCQWIAALKSNLRLKSPRLSLLSDKKTQFHYLLDFSVRPWLIFLLKFPQTVPVFKTLNSRNQPCRMTSAFCPLPYMCLPMQIILWSRKSKLPVFVGGCWVRNSFTGKIIKNTNLCFSKAKLLPCKFPPPFSVFFCHFFCHPFILPLKVTHCCWCHADLMNSTSACVPWI